MIRATRVIFAAAVATIASSVYAQGRLGFASNRPAHRVEAAEGIRHSVAAVYAIGIGLGLQPVNRRTLGDVSEPTGGYFEVVSGGDMLEGAVGRVADDLRNQYILAFEPTKADGQPHRIDTRTRDTAHRVRARSGYVAARNP